MSDRDELREALVNLLALDNPYAAATATAAAIRKERREELVTALEPARKLIAALRERVARLDAEMHDLLPRQSSPWWGPDLPAARARPSEAEPPKIYGPPTATAMNTVAAAPPSEAVPSRCTCGASRHSGHHLVWCPCYRGASTRSEAVPHDDPGLFRIVTGDAAPNSAREAVRLVPVAPAPSARPVVGESEAGRRVDAATGHRNAGVATGSHRDPTQSPAPTTVPPAPRGLEPTSTLAEVVAFLNGEDALLGFWFSETPVGEGPYWWRKHLRAAYALGVPRMVREAEERGYQQGRASTLKVSDSDLTHARGSGDDVS